tara:strand:+ start:531 stop:1373 length:843 start_codon:yes stop_codon:yes gene_type:complete
MKVLISGATGHLGSKLIDKISKNFSKIEITLIYNNKKRLNKINKSNIIKKIHFPLSNSLNGLKKNNLNFEEFDIFIHLAWPDLDNYNSDNHKNIGYVGSKKLIKFMLERGLKRILVTGTCFEYGDNIEGKINSGLIGNPVKNQYAYSKNKLRNWLFKQQNKHKFIINWVVIFYLIDSDLNYNDNILSNYLNHVKKNKLFEINNPFYAHDFILADKVIEKLILIMKNKKINGIINVGSGKIKQIHELLNHYKKIFKVKKNIVFYRNSKSINKYFWSDNNFI